MEEVRICDYCGRVLAEEEGTPVDDELLCDDCSGIQQLGDRAGTE